MNSTLKSAMGYAAVIAASFTFAATPAHAKQCIWNKGGFELDVRWHPIETLIMHANAGELGPVKFRNARTGDASLLLGQGSCAPNDARHYAVLSMHACVGVKLAGTVHPCHTPRLFRFPQGTEMGRAWKRLVFYRGGGSNYDTSLLPPSTIPCSAANGYCHAPNDSPDYFSPYTFLLIEPSTTRYLDFWGSIFDVQWGPGGPIQ